MLAPNKFTYKYITIAVYYILYLQLNKENNFNSKTT